MVYYIILLKMIIGDLVHERKDVVLRIAQMRKIACKGSNHSVEEIIEACVNSLTYCKADYWVAQKLQKGI